MAMGKRTVNSLGVIAAAIILGGVYFGVASPILTQKAATEIELEQAKLIGQNYATKLSEFQGGQTDKTLAATQTMELFQGLVSESIDIESASRAIAASLPSGVKLDSFDFGSAQQVSSLQLTPLTISGFTPPAEFSGTAPGAAQAPAAKNQQDAVKGAGGSKENLAPAANGAVDPSALISGFNRIPFTIKVTADSYGELSEYLNSLSQQPRLMSVVSIDTSRSTSVSATIYAFAFAGR